MKMKIEDLTNGELNYCCAKILDLYISTAQIDVDKRIIRTLVGSVTKPHAYEPMGKSIVAKGQCFELMEKYSINVIGRPGDYLASIITETGEIIGSQGATLKETVCRVVVLSKYPDGVDLDEI